MKYYLINNKIIFVVDAVRFLTPTSMRIDLSILEGKDYRIIVTHGIIGELLNMVEQNYYGLEKNKIIFLTNNVETQNVMHKFGCRCFNISEYIFLNDDLYNIINVEKEYDCIYMGRRAKIEGLFNIPYKTNIKKFILNESSEIDSKSTIFEYNKAFTGVMTSQAEGSCRAVAEMLMCGLPIVNIKIPSLNKNEYYPNNKQNMYGAYNIILPNTLGGRELWLNDYNSIICERNDTAIDNSIQQLIEKNLSGEKIRDEYLNKLFTERLKFLFLIKSIIEELNLNIWDIDLNTFINLPYSNCSLQSTQWIKTINYFKTIFQ
jgi:glycosyltransferase involved in cell wall biosynthesis